MAKELRMVYHSAEPMMVGDASEPLPIPTESLLRCGWREGDDVRFRWGVPRALILDVGGHQVRLSEGQAAVLGEHLVACSKGSDG